MESAKKLRPHPAQLSEGPRALDPPQQLQLSLTDRQTPPQGLRGTPREATPSHPRPQEDSVTRARPRHPQRHASSSSHRCKSHPRRERETERELQSPPLPPPDSHSSWGESPLGVDLNHLAQEVRERLSSILGPGEVSPAPPPPFPCGMRCHHCFLQLSSDVAGPRAPTQLLSKGGVS